MPKAKRLNGIWSGRARRALGAAVIAMVLVFARTLAALGQGTPDYIRDAINECDPQRYDFCKDLEEFLTVETDSIGCLTVLYQSIFLQQNASDKERIKKYIAEKLDEIELSPGTLGKVDPETFPSLYKYINNKNIEDGNPPLLSTIGLYERCIRDGYRDYMTSGNPSFSQGEKYRYFVRTIARKIDENHPEAGAYDKLDPVYKDDDENRSDASTETPTVEGTAVLSDSQLILLITVAAAQTESARTQAEQAQTATVDSQAQATQAAEIVQAQIATRVAQVQTATGVAQVQATRVAGPTRAQTENDIWNSPDGSVSTATANGAPVTDVSSVDSTGSGANPILPGPAGNEDGSDGSENPPAVASAPSPIPPVTPSPMARPIETTVQGTDSVDINPLAPSKTDVSTPGGIWDKIKKYLRELIIAAAGLVGVGAVWTLIRKRKRRPARLDRVRPAAARPAPVRPAAAPEARDIRELRENRTLRLEDGVGTDPKTMEIQAMSAFLKFDFGNMQHQGRRDYQEDSFGFSDISDPELVAKRGILAIVADGMGGLKNGKSISERAIGKFRKAFLNFSPAGNIPRQLSSLVAETNHDIYETDRQKGGTTLICVYIYRNGMYWASVGDSAIFLFRQGRLYQLNKEHNRLNELYLKFMYREITKEQLMAEPSLQGLTSNIGRRELRDLDQNLTGLRLQSGDRILLCTDGVSGRLTEKELLVAMSQGTAQACADAMKSMVLKKNAPKQDNLTAEVICCD